MRRWRGRFRMRLISEKEFERRYRRGCWWRSNTSNELPTTIGPSKKANKLKQARPKTRYFRQWRWHVGEAHAFRREEWVCFKFFYDKVWVSFWPLVILVSRFLLLKLDRKLIEYLSEYLSVIFYFLADSDEEFEYFNDKSQSFRSILISLYSFFLLLTLLL